MTDRIVIAVVSTTTASTRARRRTPSWTAGRPTSTPPGTTSSARPRTGPTPTTTLWPRPTTTSTTYSATFDGSGCAAA